MIVIVLVFLTISTGLWCWWSKIIRNGSGPVMRGSIPFVGHTLKIIGDTAKLWNFIEDMSRESLADGGVNRVIFAMETYYVITDPDDLVIAGNSCVEKHFSFKFAKAWLGDGLITGTTSIWKRHRKLLNPAFTLHLLHGFLPVFNAQSRELVDALEKEAESGIIDISHYFRENAMKTLNQTVLGVSGQDDGELFQKYTDAADQILELIVLRFQNVWLQSELVFKLTGLQKKQTDLIKILNDMSDAVIKKKRSEMDYTTANSNTSSNSGLKYKAFLDLLLELSADNMLTDKEIREEVDSIIVAGTDTSSWLVTYTCAALGTYPQVQNQVVEELNQIFGDTNRDVNKEDLLKLVYLEAVIKETLRLYPVAPVSLRTVETGIRLKNTYLRPGDHIIMSFYGVNRHPVWGPDADQFRPERWLEADTLPNAYGGFGMGKRGCIGKTFAMISMKTLLVHVLRRYVVSGDVTKLKLKMDFIAKPVSGHLVSISERNHRSDRIRKQA